MEITPLKVGNLKIFRFHLILSIVKLLTNSPKGLISICQIQKFQSIKQRCQKKKRNDTNIKQQLTTKEKNVTDKFNIL